MTQANAQPGFMQRLRAAGSMLLGKSLSLSDPATLQRFFGGGGSDRHGGPTRSYSQVSVLYAVVKARVKPWRACR